MRPDIAKFSNKNGTTWTLRVVSRGSAYSASWAEVLGPMSARDPGLCAATTRHLVAPEALQTLILSSLWCSCKIEASVPPQWDQLAAAGPQASMRIWRALPLAVDGSVQPSASSTKRHTRPRFPGNAGLPVRPLRNQSAHRFANIAGSALGVRRVPCAVAATPALPFPLDAASCRCRRPLDACGDDRAACPQSGLLRLRGAALQRARVCREAGAQVAVNVLFGDLSAQVQVQRQDDRCIGVIANVGTCPARGHHCSVAHISPEFCGARTAGSGAVRLRPSHPKGRERSAQVRIGRMARASVNLKQQTIHPKDGRRRNQYDPNQHPKNTEGGHHAAPPKSPCEPNSTVQRE